MGTVLVTGATGFVGRHLLPVLSLHGWRIRAAVRGEGALERLLASSSEACRASIFPVTTGELHGETDWSAALQGVDTVVHLAARAHIIHDRAEDPEAEFHRVNVEGTANLVRQSREAGVQHFVFISSVGAMCSLSDTPLTEDSPCRPDGPYGRSKLEAERALVEGAHGMAWTIVRPTLVYGPGNPGNMERLIQLIRRGLPIPLGGLCNRRSLVYVENLVHAIASMLGKPQAMDQTFLVSDGEDLSTPELIRKIAFYMRRRCRLVPVPPVLFKMMGTVGSAVEVVSGRHLPVNRSTVAKLLGSLSVSCDHLQGTLHWRPPFSLDEGLSRTVRPLCN